MAVKTGSLIVRQWSWWTDSKQNWLGGLQAQHMKMGYEVKNREFYAAYDDLSIFFTVPDLRFFRP